MSIMIVYVLFDIAMALVFLFFGLLFYNSKGKATNFLTGYNMKTKEERKRHDEMEMSKVYGKRIMYWAIPFLMGAIIDIKYTGKGILIAWGVWLILFVLFLFRRYKCEG